LGKNRFSGAHFDSVALSLLRKNRKRSSYRSHLKSSQSLLFSTRLFIHNLAKPDDSDRRVEDQQMIAAFQHFAQDKIVKDGLPVLTVDFATSAHDLVVAGYLNSNDFQHFDHNGFSIIDWSVTTFMTNSEISSSGILPSGRAITWHFPLTNVAYKNNIR
jgi:hypothetical protein